MLRPVTAVTPPFTILMLYTLCVVLLVLWLLGFFAFHVSSGLIHLLLVVALVVLVVQVLTGRRGV